RQESEQKYNENTSAEPGADPYQNQRQKRDLRRGVERSQQRRHRVGQTSIPAGGEPNRYAYSNREHQAEHVAEPAPGEVASDFAGDEEHAESGRRDQRRRGDENRLQ